jgi:hypothetical protein
MDQMNQVDQLGRPGGVFKVYAMAVRHGVEQMGQKTRWPQAGDDFLHTASSIHMSPDQIAMTFFMLY